MIRPFALGLLLLVPVSFAACSGDDPAIVTDGGVDGASPGSDGGGGSCASLPAQEELAVLPESALGHLGLGAGGLVVSDPRAGLDTGDGFLPKTGALLVVPKTGGAPTPLYTPPANRVLGAFFVAGADVLAIDYELGASGTTGRLVHQRFGEPSATPIGAGKLDGIVSYVAGIDAASVYVVAPGSPGKFRVVRVDRASGAETDLATVDGTQLGQAQVHGGFVWFYGAQGAGALYKVPVAGGETTRVTDKTCFGGGLLVADGGFYCGTALTLSKYDATFTGQVRLFDALDLKNATAPRANAIVGGEVIVTVAIETKARTEIFAVPDAGGARRTVACDVGYVRSLEVEGEHAYFLDEKEGAGKRLYRVRYGR